MNRDEFTIGSRVIVNDEHSGTIRYFGTTSFQTGKWVGVELDEKVGKNSGVVQGKRYFDCKIDHGVFIRPANVKLIDEVKRKIYMHTMYLLFVSRYVKEESLSYQTPIIIQHHLLQVREENQLLMVKTIHY